MDNPSVSLRSVTIFGGKANKIRAKLRYAEFATTAEGLYKIVITKNPTSITDGTYAIPTGREDSSTIEVNEGITAYTGGIECLLPTYPSVLLVLE